MCLCASGALLRGAFRFGSRPSASPAYGSPEEVRSRVSGAGPAAPGLSVTFLGVSTLLVTDGETSLLTDGFFSRPCIPVWLKPNAKRIDAALARAGIRALAAVLVSHSHYDHALDAPAVALRTGAVVVGSPSAANVARGGGLPAERIHAITSEAPLGFGQFRVTFIRAEHGVPCLFKGDIHQPLTPPAFVCEYKEGGSYSILIEHPLGSLLLHASAGYVPGALAGRRADVVLLGVAELGNRPASFQEAYFTQVVKALGARAVYPVHWDLFTRPLHQPLEVLSDATREGMDWLKLRAASDGLAYDELKAFQPVTLFCAQAG